MNLLPFVATGIGLGAIYGLSAVGIVVLYRSSGTINFAFGALGAAGAHLTWSLIQYLGMPVAPAWVAGIALSTLLSWVYGRFISSRLANSSQSVRAIATLGLALLLLGIISAIFGPGLPRRLSLPTDYMNIVVFGLKISYTRLGIFLFALLAVVGLNLLLARTRTGLSMRALASNRTVSSQIGIDTTKVDSIAWLISGAFAGLSGLVLADLLLMSPIPLTFLVIPALAAAILGRLTSMPWAFFGGMVVGQAEALLTVAPMLSSVRSAAPYLIALLFVAFATGLPSGDSE